MMGLWGVVVLGLALSMCVEAAYEFDEFTSADAPIPDPVIPNAPMINRTLIQGAAAKGAVCLDGTLPAYHFDPGFGSGANSWLVDLEGGGWCNDIASCVERKSTRRGSSNYMPDQLAFPGILSNKPDQNPDFFNWNRVKIRYCDGASFAGEGENKTAGLQFRGQRIWEAAIEELMSKGMRNANQALLHGGSAGGLASILHCDEFKSFFSSNVKVKCLADAGLFMDAKDVSGGHALRDIYQGVVTLQNVSKNLPSTCTDHLDPTSCFFPQNVINNIKTPLFILNSAYDTWQIHMSLTPSVADPKGIWRDCKDNLTKCSESQLQFFQNFRIQMLNALKGFAERKQNGLFINSCFVHGQAETQDFWFSDNQPLIGNKGIGSSVGDWYFDRSDVKAIDCPYPCDKTCHHLFK